MPRPVNKEPRSQVVWSYYRGSWRTMIVVHDPRCRGPFYRTLKRYETKEACIQGTFEISEMAYQV